jgi:hypothetical protein
VGAGRSEIVRAAGHRRRDPQQPPDGVGAWAPGLREALTGLGEGDFVIVDGTLIPTDRIRADEPYYSKSIASTG